MKTMIVMFGCVFATLDTFALTETIDGITWNYYIEDGHAILEYPEIRNTAPYGVRPESANSTNDLPSEINIPAKLGGYEVAHLGAIALQVSSCGAPVTTTVVPDSVTKLSDFAFVGDDDYSFGQVEVRSGSGYCYYTYRWSLIGSMNILFLGNKPEVNSEYTDSSWLHKSGRYEKRNGGGTGGNS